MNTTEIIGILKKLDRGKNIQFIVLFGSKSKKTDNVLSDIDIAVYYLGTDKERFSFRVKASGHLSDLVDLHIFQDLPLPIQKEVISGTVLYYRDYQFAFDEFMRVIKEFDFFKKYYDEYFTALEAKV